MGIVSIQEPLLRDNVNSSAFEQLISGPQTPSSCGGFNRSSYVVLTVISPTYPASVVYGQSGYLKHIG